MIGIEGGGGRMLFLLLLKMNVDICCNIFEIYYFNYNAYNSSLNVNV